MIHINKIGRKRKALSIKVKIFVYLIGFCTLLLILLWLAQVVFLDSFYKNIKINEVKQSAGEIIGNIDNEGLDELIDDICDANEVSVEIITKDGVQIYSGSEKKQSIIWSMPIEKKLKLLSDTAENGGELLGYYKTEDFHNEMFDDIRFKGDEPSPFGNSMESIIYTKIINTNSGDTYALFITSVISPVDATVSTLRIQLYCITGIMLIFSVVTALLIAKRVSKPIESINESAKILALGKYDTHFDNGGYREIGELSDTLNFTAGELSKVEGLRRELIANVSHDLRTPLTLIGGYAEAMRDLPDENTPENAQIIIDETKRLTTLVNDMLDISKLQSGKQELILRDYNLTASVSGVVESLRQLLKKDSFSISFIYDEEVSIYADETKISQAFYNLLINAVNYSGDEKEVTVRQLVSPESVKIEVSDKGEGISEKMLPFIWDRYYKADKNHRRAVTGSGLGLSIVRSVIELHGGEYGVSSATGKGSVFWFSLKR